MAKQIDPQVAMADELFDEVRLSMVYFKIFLTKH